MDPAEGLAFADWLDRIEDIALDYGEFDPLGPDHSAILIRGTPNLLVTFELVDDIRAQSNSDIPFGWQMAESHNWTQLTILANKKTWFRHKAIYQYFDRLVDEGFFDEFDNVVFCGADSCGYAALAFSVAAPGCTVLAMSPQATLDPRLTEWDFRHPNARRLNFTDRYGFAPKMSGGAEKVYLFYDPYDPQDAMHAALFNDENVTRVRCTHFNGQIELFLRRMGVLDGLIQMAMRRRLSQKIIARALRERRGYLPYLRRLMLAVEQRERPYLMGLMCRSVLTRINAPRFHRQLNLAEQELAAEGRALPSPRLAKSA